MSIRHAWGCEIFAKYPMGSDNEILFQIVCSRIVPRGTAQFLWQNDLRLCVVSGQQTE
jgi:hypothetical protein